ncbi:MAG: NAD(P)H-dependent oxidoreductase [Proteobacteria bacterium]|uniref:NAD(P)H-dependent oxidoreductase n=1 Tax=Candidatus Avisuccinivibrio stercorigallinarum TaxID=2840704 RepID=A0A9D9GT41_9GAMM|nr:NAD(P)H-dependent oxidoreductase [Candidatus Avisuccinivibrio stercorigallinarum]
MRKFTKITAICGVFAAVMAAGSALAADFSTHKTAVLYYTLLHNRVGGDDFAAEHSVGNTENIANIIAEQTGADKFELQQTELYPNSYDETVDIAKEEQERNARPALKSVPDLSAYDVVFMGFPCWWGSYPMAFATYFDSVDLSGKTIVPFTTHGGSRFGHSIQDLKAALPQSTIVEGLAVRDRDAQDADISEDVTEFLNDLELN